MISLTCHDSEEGALGEFVSFSFVVSFLDRLRTEHVGCAPHIPFTAPQLHMRSHSAMEKEENVFVYSYKS
jgi:hypothetical protein